MDRVYATGLYLRNLKGSVPMGIDHPKAGFFLSSRRVMLSMYAATKTF